ncbi:subtilisin-like protease SBT3.9 [Magnolia sinica]|uniref:subtilisin-like protease SBT3.9 n=1 Tax=Magnolia sinica TaxID=86752 RepID=UPI002657FC3E|nr:subtilisin-like protease SBT3.9 [Magnolia sinica]
MVKMGLTTTVVGSSVLAPKIASFSSRGPSPFNSTILKPDVAAPGVNILAAINDGYEFRSGTSMSCPHVAGIAALLRSLHPNWSPAAIKSALVTTASITDEYGLPITAEGAPRKLADPFDYGGGHVSPNKAIDPGLIYDIDAADYFNWVNGSISDLNLPSISIPSLKTIVTVSRTVTNVGPVNSTYIATIQSPPGVKMDVTPSILIFNNTVTKHSFKITFSTIRRVQGDYTFGSLIWSDYKHLVKIPIAVRTVIQDFYADVSL